MKFTNYLNKSFYFILFLLMGLGLFFWPSIKTSFDLIIGDATTTPYKIFVLEHSYLWLNNIEPHSSFWSAPFNYPNEMIAVSCYHEILDVYSQVDKSIFTGYVDLYYTKN